jgi:hypothetical protein
MVKSSVEDKENAQRIMREVMQFLQRLAMWSHGDLTLNQRTEQRTEICVNGTICELSISVKKKES